MRKSKLKAPLPPLSSSEEKIISMNKFSSDMPLREEDEHTDCETTVREVTHFFFTYTNKNTGVTANYLQIADYNTVCIYIHEHGFKQTFACRSFGGNRVDAPGKKGAVCKSKRENMKIRTITCHWIICYIYITF